MKRNRRLSEAETALWKKVVEKVLPLDPDSGFVPTPDRSEPRPLPAPAPIRPFVIGEKSTARTEAVPRATMPANTDKNRLRRLKKGQLKVDRRVDLHGLTLAEARPVLNNFVFGAHAAGKKVLLVITGKGKSGPDIDVIPTRRGILRQQVPQWLASAPLREVVSEVVPAHRYHGGEGACYVFLRRRR